MKHKIGDFRCETCNKVFASKKECDEHCLTHDLEQIIKMSSNDGLKTSPYTSQTHLKPHACSQCGKSYKRKDHLKRHELQHTGERPHICVICTKAFFRKDKLIRHESIHFKDKQRPFKCLDCDKVFFRKDSLDKHRRNVHGKLFDREPPAETTPKELGSDGVKLESSYLPETSFSAKSNAALNSPRPTEYNNVPSMPISRSVDFDKLNKVSTGPDLRTSQYGQGSAVSISKPSDFTRPSGYDVITASTSKESDYRSLLTVSASTTTPSAYRNISSAAPAISRQSEYSNVSTIATSQFCNSY